MDEADAEAQVLARLERHPEGLPTMALIDHLTRRGVPPSAALDVVWKLRDKRSVEMRFGRVVLSETKARSTERV